MSRAAAGSAEAVRPPVSLPLPNVGMILFLGSELMFFAALFAGYFTLRAQTRVWPPAGANLELAVPAVFTAALVLSSGTMQLAVEGVRRGDRAGAMRWLAATAALGVVFLAGQGLDYATKDFSIASNAYGSMFFTMTGFHALHVFAGIVLLLVAMGRAGAGAYTPSEHAGLEAIGYYWHFVDVVWLALFATIFLVK